jgi:hypothetical protein
MTAPLSSIVLAEIAERAVLAARYAEAAAALAAVGDGPAMAHSIACAGRAIHSAIEAAALLRPKSGEAQR